MGKKKKKKKKKGPQGMKFEKCLQNFKKKQTYINNKFIILIYF
jgi:hypothetical protein